MKRVAIQFVQEGEKVNKIIRREGSLEDACDWEMQVDLGGKLVVPQEIAFTNLRPDIVSWSMTVYFIKLTVPWEKLVAEAYERTKLRYVELGAEAEQRGWKVRIEDRGRGFVAKSVVSLLRELEISGQSMRKIVKEMADEAVKSSQWIWIRKSNSSWGSSRGST